MKDSEGFSFTTNRVFHASSGAGRSHAAMVFQVNGNRHKKRAGEAGVALRASGTGKRASSLCRPRQWAQ